MIHPESARLSEEGLRARMLRVEQPNPLIHVGPAYPIQTFEHWGNPYVGYYHGAVVVVDSWLGEEVWVEERSPVTREELGDVRSNNHHDQGEPVYPATVALTDESTAESALQ